MKPTHKPSHEISLQSIAKDLLAGLIVFLVAVPLCLGIAVASGADPIAGLIAGIVGGIVIGVVSGSQTSVSGPAAGLTAIVAAQIANLGTFETFLLAVVMGGLIQIGLGLCKAGALSAFFPSSVIKGLLAAIGVILILKQLPHLFGHDSDPEGEMSFEQPDHENTFTEFFKSIQEILQNDIQAGALTIGIFSLAFLIAWNQIKPLKKSLVPAPLIVVILGVVFGRVFSQWSGTWAIAPGHMVNVPIASDLQGIIGFLRFPDFTQLLNPAVYIGGITIAVVASLETLLNLDAVDKLDKKQRVSPPNRELVAQGIGNVVAGMIGGIPVTSVVIRGSVNVHAGAETKLSTIFHGVLLLVCVVLMPTYLNMIPLSCLAAILLLTGYKLAHPKLFQEMWSEGRYQFLPFLLTLIAIVLTDLLIGILIGLAIALLFILNSNLRRPIRRIHEKHIDGDVLHIELANQVSFLNRASLENALREAPRGSRILLDARRTDYIDPDVLSLIREFKNVTAPVYDLQVRLIGFRDKYKLMDSVETVDFSAKEARDQLTALEVMEILREGNRRFAEGHPLDRIPRRIADRNGEPNKSIVAIFAGIDPRTPVEMIFDLSLGDAYVVRMPGTVVGPRAIGGLEFATSVGGVRLIVVMGHADSSLMSLALENAISPDNKAQLAGCANLESVLEDITRSLDDGEAKKFPGLTAIEQTAFLYRLTRRHVLRSVQQVLENSQSLQQSVSEGRVAIVGAIFNPESGSVEFLMPEQTNRSQ